MNNKMVRFHFVVIVTLIASAGCRPPNRPNADSGDCLSRMAEETAAYIKQKKIPMKGSDGELYGNEKEQVYLLNSQEQVKLASNEPVKSTVAVINRKEGAQSSFYLIEQEISADKITFTLSKDSQVLESLPIPLIRSAKTIPDPGGGAQSCEIFCDTANANAGVEARLQALQAEANQTCSRRFLCLEICLCSAGTVSYPQTLFYADPTSWRCLRDIAVKNLELHFFAVRNTGPFLDEAFDIALRKTFSRHTH